MLICDAQVHICGATADMVLEEMKVAGVDRYDAYGPRRMFWGSDLTRLPGPYRQCVTLFTEELPWLSGADKEWIMGRALCNWLGWPV